MFDCFQRVIAMCELRKMNISFLLSRAVVFTVEQKSVNDILTLIRQPNNYLFVLLTEKHFLTFVSLWWMCSPYCRLIWKSVLIDLIHGQRSSSSSNLRISTFLSFYYYYYFRCIELDGICFRYFICDRSTSLQVKVRNLIIVY